MRKIILDTETTGLDFRTGDRVIEIGCVEMLSRQLSGVRFHKYINPERDVPAGAVAIHGLTSDFLADKPKFADIAEEFIAFVRGAELIIHNAPFDTGFLNHELGLMRRENLDQLCSGVTDTLRMARDLRPGKRASLDVLCGEFGINNTHRTLHGALLDAELLAEVYLAMTRGQNTLTMDFAAPAANMTTVGASERPLLKVVRACDAELAEHARVLTEIGKESKGKCLWMA
ncbi:MAG: DNA polymerase III subunit epsilon [Rugosibacter sp.]